MSNEKNNLYVLRYNYSGNYYVGTAESFEKRMFDHLRRTSIEKGLSKWSKENKSTKGFKFYWFTINQDGVPRSEADICEDRLTELLDEIIENTNKEKFIREVYVRNNKSVDGSKICDIEVKADNSPNGLNDIDKKIMDYLKELKLLETKKGEFSIECCGIGSLGEYDHSQCNKTWSEVESDEFPSDNNE